MNKLAWDYWNAFTKDVDAKVTAWQFGASPDELAQLVIDGVKTATCSAHLLYELEGEAPPEVGEYSIILNSRDEPVAMIKTTEVAVLPMNEVTADFARAEGEGDLSYEYWWNVHETFFTEALQDIGKDFTADLLLVCERFVLVDVKK